MLVVTSAGNDGQNRDRVPSYPASERSPSVITVASTDRAGALAPGSAFGRSTVDLAAPGDEILTSDLGGRFSRRSGTSFAAAYVTEAAALLAAAQPGATAHQPPDGADRVLTARRPGGARVAGGELDAAAAVRRLGRLRPR